MNITAQTRQMSFEDINLKRKQRYDQILGVLANREMTAKEIAIEMFELQLIPSTERNYTAPRLTELERLGQVKVIKKKKCKWSGKTVAVYTRTQKGFEELNYSHIPRMD